MLPNPESNEIYKPISIVRKAQLATAFDTRQQSEQYEQIRAYFSVDGLNRAALEKPDFDNIDPAVKARLARLFVSTISATRNTEEWQHKKQILKFTDEDIKLAVVSDLFHRIGSESFSENKADLERAFGVPPEFYEAEEAKQKATIAVINAYLGSMRGLNHHYPELFSITSEMALPMIEGEIVASYFNNSKVTLNQLSRILSVFNIGDRFESLSTDPTISSVLNNVTQEMIYKGNAHVLNEMLTDFDFVNLNPENKNSYTNLVLTKIGDGQIDLISDITNKLLSINSPEYYQALRFGIYRFLVNPGSNMSHIFNLTSENIENEKFYKEILARPEFNSLLLEKFQLSLEHGDVAAALKIKNLTNLDNFIHTPKGQDSLKNCFIISSPWVRSDDYFELEALIKSDHEILRHLNSQHTFANQYYGYRTQNLDVAIDPLDITGVRPHMTPETLRCIELNNEMFGDSASIQTFECIQNLFYGRISKSLSELGVTKVGKDGLEELKTYINNWRSTVNNPDLNLLLNNPILAAFFKSYIGFEGGGFGRHDDNEFKRIVSNYQKNLAEGKISLLPPEYQPSRFIQIETADRAKRSEFAHSEGFLSRFNTLKNSVSGALELLKNEHPLKYLGEQISEIRQQVTVNLEKQKERLTENPKAIAHLQQQIDQLNSINIFSYNFIQQNFAKLGRYAEFSEILRQGIFYVALHRHKEQVPRVSQLINRETPTFEDITTMIDFVDHITNKETFAEYFTDKDARRKFKELADVKALEEELGRMNDAGNNGMATYQFIPSQFLGEFSGQIADACWASRYNCISAEFPNMTTIIMVKNPQDSKLARLAGAAILIETQAEDGTPVSVIRGLNPQQNIINSLVISDFYQKFTEYCRSIASARGRELLIVVDGHSGGASTNRPALHQYLVKNMTHSPRKLASAQDTTFNGYDIVNHTFLA